MCSFLSPRQKLPSLAKEAAVHRGIFTQADVQIGRGIANGTRHPWGLACLKTTLLAGDPEALRRELLERLTPQCRIDGTCFLWHSTISGIVNYPNMSTPAAYWDILSAAWEQCVATRDAWDRVPSTASPHGNVLDPSVSQRLHELGFRPTYPNGCSFAVCLSHDVDVLITSQRELFGTMRRGRIPITGRNVLAVLRRGVDPRWDLEGILKMEQALGVPSSFYFLALEPGDEDFNFSVKEIGDQLRMVRSAGNEIGLHGGHAA